MHRATLPETAVAASHASPRSLFRSASMPSFESFGSKRRGTSSSLNVRVAGSRVAAGFSFLATLLSPLKWNCWTKNTQDSPEAINNPASAA